MVIAISERIALLVLVLVLRIQFFVKLSDKRYQEETRVCSRKDFSDERFSLVDAIRLLGAFYLKTTSLQAFLSKPAFSLEAEEHGQCHS